MWPSASYARDFFRTVQFFSYVEPGVIFFFFSFFQKEPQLAGCIESSPAWGQGSWEPQGPCLPSSLWSWPLKEQKISALFQEWMGGSLLLNGSLEAMFKIVKTAGEYAPSAAWMRACWVWLALNYPHRDSMLTTNDRISAFVDGGNGMSLVKPNKEFPGCPCEALCPRMIMVLVIASKSNIVCDWGTRSQYLTWCS